MLRTIWNADRMGRINSTQNEEGPLGEKVNSRREEEKGCSESNEVCKFHYKELNTAKEDFKFWGLCESYRYYATGTY